MVCRPICLLAPFAHFLIIKTSPFQFGFQPQQDEGQYDRHNLQKINQLHQFLTGQSHPGLQNLLHKLNLLSGLPGLHTMAEQLKVMTKKINENLLRKELANQRNTFSRELHDRLGIIISSLKLQIERLSTI